MDEYESVVIPIYEELLVACLTNIMSDVSNSDLARTYGQLMASEDDVSLCFTSLILHLWLFVSDFVVSDFAPLMRRLGFATLLLRLGFFVSDLFCP